MNLKGKVAIITGAGSGIGRATALLFAQEGAKVTVVDINKETGMTTVDRIHENRGTAIFVHADVTKVSDAQRIANESFVKFGAIDILFNNAGVFLAGNILATDEARWDTVMNISLKGTYLCSKFVIPKMMEQRRGVVLNMGSITGIRAISNASAYCAAKAGVIQLTKNMALDFAPYNIRVNCICPGPILTKPEFKQSFPSGLLPPLNRPGEPEEVAKVALFLASEAASFMTGSILVVDGGAISGKYQQSYGPGAQTQASKNF